MGKKRRSIIHLLFWGLMALLLSPAPISAAAETPPQGVENCPGLTLDWSSLSSGTLTLAAAAQAGPLEARLSRGDEAYRYSLPGDGSVRILPLQMGEGDYTLEIFRPAGEGRYTRILSRSFSVSFSSPQAPFLANNLFVPPDDSGALSALCEKLTGNCPRDGKKVDILYGYVSTAIAYDGEKGALLDGSYLPDPARTLQEGRGICLDYASLLAALCRQAGIPAKLVTGHLTDSGIYHAWNEVYYGGRWHRLDPTLGIAGGNRKNYTAERIY